MKVRVYWNRHRKNWSVLRYDKGWRVWKRLNKLTLNNCQFVVKEKGRQRCLQQNKRNVHAWCEGILEKYSDLNIPFLTKRKIRYNPFISGNFTIRGKPIEKITFVDFVGKHCYAWTV